MYPFVVILFGLVTVLNAVNSLRLVRWIESLERELETTQLFLRMDQERNPPASPRLRLQNPSADEVS